MHKPDACNARALPFSHSCNRAAPVALALLVIALLSNVVVAEEAPADAATAQSAVIEDASLDEVLQSLKRDVLALNRDLFIRTACLLSTFAFFTAGGKRL